MFFLSNAVPSTTVIVISNLPSLFMRVSLLRAYLISIRVHVGLHHSPLLSASQTLLTGLIRILLTRPQSGGSESDQMTNVPMSVNLPLPPPGPGPGADTRSDSAPEWLPGWLWSACRRSALTRRQPGRSDPSPKLEPAVNSEWETVRDRDLPLAMTRSGGLGVTTTSS